MKPLNSSSLWMMLGMVMEISPFYLLEGLDVCYTTESLLGLRRILSFGLSAPPELLVWILAFRLSES